MLGLCRLFYLYLSLHITLSVLHHSVKLLKLIIESSTKDGIFISVLNNPIAKYLAPE